MKVSITTVGSILWILVSTDAFTVSTPHAHNQMALQAAAAATSNTDQVGYIVVRKAIRKLDKDNFSTTLSKVEPFLLDTAGASFYRKSMNRIQHSAKSLGVSIPTDFAKKAKATEKRRTKQDAFVQKKIEDAKAAEEAAAAAAAAAAASEEDVAA